MDKRRTDTKKIILKMTEEALTKTDYASLSLRDLAKKCGLSATTMYKHFSSKDDLFQHVHSRLANRKLEKFLKGQPSPPSPDSKEKILSLGIYILQEFERDPKTMSFLFFSSYAETSFLKEQTANKHNQSLLEEYAIYISELKIQYHLQESEESLFIRFWSFLQGYSLLVSNGITGFDEAVLKQTINDFIKER